jgi:hypothetical protein
MKKKKVKIIFKLLLLFLCLILYSCYGVREGNSNSNNNNEIKKIELSDEELKQLQVLRYFREDPICFFKGMGILNVYSNDDLVSISPNPTMSFVNIQLLSPIIKFYEKNASSMKVSLMNLELNGFFVHLQLLINEKIIHQWNIENYWNAIEKIPEEYLKEQGTYLLVCNFVGAEGCTFSASNSFMVIKK